MIGIIVSIIVFIIIIGGIVTLLKNKDFKIPDNYKPQKSEFDDEKDDDSSGY